MEWRMGRCRGFGGRSTYLTVRAWRSVGAPDSTAAARASPGSLPSMTRFGTGEKVLRLSLDMSCNTLAGNLRGAIVNGDIVIRLMPHCSFLWVLGPDHGRFGLVRTRRICGTRLWCRFGSIRAVSRCDSPSSKWAQRTWKQP